eukprot:3674147-Pleurochrysis_carterae.AAC.5
MKPGRISTKKTRGSGAVRRASCDARAPCACRRARAPCSALRARVRAARARAAPAAAPPPPRAPHAPPAARSVQAPHAAQHAASTIWSETDQARYTHAREVKRSTQRAAKSAHLHARFSTA